MIALVMLSAGVAMAQDAPEAAKEAAAPAVKAVAPAVEKAADGFVVAETVTVEATEKVEGEKAPAAEGENAEEAKDGEGGQADEKKGPFDNKFLFIMLGMIVLMFIFSSRSKKKQQKKRQELLNAVTKGSKIVTIGGIVGTVVEARDDEIIVKIDDNTRMKFARWAIRSAGEEAQADKKDDTQQDR